MTIRKVFIPLLIAVLLAGISTASWAAGTAAQAETMVKKAISFYKANGKDKAFAEISNPKGQFVKEDLYVFVYDMTGKVMAHGFNKAMIGKDLIDMRDPDGKFSSRSAWRSPRQKEKAGRITNSRTRSQRRLNIRRLTSKRLIATSLDAAPISDGFRQTPPLTNPSYSGSKTLFLTGIPDFFWLSLRDPDRHCYSICARNQHGQTAGKAYQLHMCDRLKNKGRR